MFEETLQRLQHRHEELQREYNLVSENIRCLAEDYHNATRAREKLRLKRELENEEEDRDKIEQEMFRLEMQMKNLHICRVYDELLRLDCIEHLQRFEEFIAQHQVGAFVLHGCSKYGVRFLLKRILKDIAFSVTSFHPIKIDIPSMQKFNSFHCFPSIETTDIDVETLWNALGRKLSLTRNPSPTQIASKISQKWEKEHIILVFEMDSTCDLITIIDKFWLNLAERVLEYSSQTTNVFLLLLLIDDSEYLNTCGIEFVETYDEAWTPALPVKLPPVDRYCVEEIKAWIYHSAIFPLGYRKNVSTIIHDILEYSENGFPDRVMEYICTQLCQCDFNEGVLDEWLKL